MRILYGVCGEGMGHAIRSAVVGSHLRGLGWDVTYVCSLGRAFDYLKKSRSGRVIPTLGTHMALRRNRVDEVGTALGNAALQVTIGPAAHALTAMQVSKVDAVVSDFDPWSARYARGMGLPLIALDNVHFMSRFQHSSHALEGAPGDRKAAAVMYPIVRGMVPNASRYMVTSFVGAGQAPAVLGKTTVHLPILRPIVSALRPSVGDHVVVYFNDKADSKRIGELRGLGVPFRVYGTGTSMVVQSGEVTLMPMGDSFLHDMATSRAVIAGAGFTTMTEAIYMGKPVLAVPFEGQFEQILNANYLGLCRYGERALGGLSRSGVEGFLGRSDKYRANLAGLKHDNNRELLASVVDALRGKA